MSSHVDDFNIRNRVLTAKPLKQGYRYHKLRKAFSKFNQRHFDKVSKYNVGLKTLLLQGLSEPEFDGDLVYKIRKIIGNNDFPYHFKKVIDLFHIVISLSLAARYLARFRVTSQAWGKL